MQRLEEIEQAKFIRWTHKAKVREVIPDLQWIFHVPNGGARSGFTGAQMKALGVKPGVPDLLLPIDTPHYNGLAMEFKSPTGKGRVSADQNGWIRMFQRNSWQCEVVKTAQEAIDAICEYLELDDFRYAMLPPIE